MAKDVSRDRWIKASLLTGSGLLWLALVAIPLGSVLIRLRSVTALLDPEILQIVRFTAIQASVSTAISILIGFPLGLVLGRPLALADRFSGLRRMLLAMPYGVPTVVAGTAWVIWLGRSGILAESGLRLDWAYTAAGVVTAHVFFNAPWVALLVSESRARIANDLIDAAGTLGAGSWGRFKWITWPAVKWVLASSATQVFSLCVMSFALVLILGGGPPVQTLETALYARMRYGSLDLDGAVACGIWELTLTLLPWALLLLIQPSWSAAERETAGVRPRGSGSSRRQSGWLVFATTLVSALFMVPYVAVIFSSGMKPWQALLAPGSIEQLSTPLKWTAILAILSGIGTLGLTLLSVLAARALAKVPAMQRLFTTLWVLPSGISVLVLGLGFWLAYGKWLDPFSGSLTAMVALQAILFTPVAFRMIWPVARSSPEILLEAATGLGASKLQRFLAVEWPRLRSPIFSALAIVMGASVGEVAAVSLFYGEGIFPLPLLLSRWMGQYRFEEAQALSAVLLVLASGTIALVSRWGFYDKRS
ncbi:MAG: hypothetical protein A2X94_12760 [Bdellovibrionales bacterium GWB1_55_8]|nr:MAG: hypothetical protein A2X94_12760 [Bdellovibrionales bacterium GWB1_55_8]